MLSVDFTLQGLHRVLESQTEKGSAWKSHHYGIQAGFPSPGGTSVVTSRYCLECDWYCAGCLAASGTKTHAFAVMEMPFVAKTPPQKQKHAGTRNRLIHFNQMLPKTNLKTRKPGNKFLSKPAPKLNGNTNTMLENLFSFPLSLFCCIKSKHHFRLRRWKLRSESVE